MTKRKTERVDIDEHITVTTGGKRRAKRKRKAKRKRRAAKKRKRLPPFFTTKGIPWPEAEQPRRLVIVLK